MRNAITAILAVCAIGWIVGAGIAVSANGRGSEIVREWVVGKYVNAGINPYPVAKDILTAHYGAGNPNRVKIFAIPTEVPPHRTDEILPEFGPPEATYPPPAIGILALTLGMLASPDAVMWVWFFINIVATIGVAHGLTRLWRTAPGGATEFDNYRILLAALLLFPPTFSTVQAGQFSLVVLGLLLAANDPSVGWLPRGLALGVALVKPSIALPFLFLPLVRREWRVLFTTIAVQAIAGAYAVVQIGDVANTYRDWLTIARYFLHGMYTLQDWMNPISHRLPWIVPAGSLSVLALCGISLALARNLSRSGQFGLACVTSIFWTYHSAYDFVMLLPVLLPLAGWTERQPSERWAAVGLAIFAVLAIALTPAVIGGDDSATRIIRWLARFVMIGLFVSEYIHVLRSILRTRDTGHQSVELSSVPALEIETPKAAA